MLFFEILNKQIAKIEYDRKNITNVIYYSIENVWLQEKYWKILKSMKYSEFSIWFSDISTNYTDVADFYFLREKVTKLYTDIKNFLYFLIR